MEEVKHEKCKKCKCWRQPQQFLNNKGRKLKSCDDCRRRSVIWNNKNKCEHGRAKHRCKECGGSGICEHNRIRITCKECGGSQICEHKNRRSVCKECVGGSICEHKKTRTKCKECKGSLICAHERLEYTCKDCKGSYRCEHGKLRNLCKECEGRSMCEHNRRRFICKVCDPSGHLTNVVKSRVRHALKSNKNKTSIQYLGCSIEEFKEHIENQFEAGMSWDNYGKWHIDHITPLKYGAPTLEEVAERLHYMNTQPLWAEENIAKGNRHIG